MNKRVWVNFKELRQKLRFEDVLRHFGVEISRKGEQHQGACPLPQHPGSRRAPSFSANLERGLFRCFSCGSQGNLLEFACMMTGHSPSDADALRAVAVELQQKLIGTGDSRTRQNGASPPPKNPGETVVVNRPLDFELKDLDAGHESLAGRGFTRETVRHFGAGFCSRGFLKGRVAIPLRDTGGALLGYAGRVPKAEDESPGTPKYVMPSRREAGGTIYELRTSLFLYNGHRIERPAAGLIVVSGFAAVWWVTQGGFPDCVATMGESCSDEQADLIVSKTAEDGTVWVVPPGTEGGECLALELFRKVAPRRAVRWVKLGAGRKPTDLPPLTLRETIRI